jgi:hypothetical protein
MTERRLDAMARRAIFLQHDALGSVVNAKVP